jgi:hypothetical protein
MILRSAASLIGSDLPSITYSNATSYQEILTASDIDPTKEE